MKIKIFLFLFLIISISYANEARLLRYPNSSQTQIVFFYAGNLYVVDKSGGVARKLTSSEGYEMFPQFSPDGNFIALSAEFIAFSAEYDGNREV